MADRSRNESPLPFKKQKDALGDLLEKMDEDLRSKLRNGLITLCKDRHFALGCLRVTLCNGSTGFGVPFTDAFCYTEIPSENPCFPFASIFNEGLQLLKNILDEPSDTIIQDVHMRLIFSKLLSFFTNTDLLDFVIDLEENCQALLEDETELSVAMAEHLFAKLALQNSYVLNHRMKNSGSSGGMLCGCGCKTYINKFGDTSIGEKHVWHGNLDLVVSDVPIFITEEKEVCHGEVEYVSPNHGLWKHQMIAQTIVFSFLQKKIHPEASHHLIPCIGISPKEVIFYFYESQKDILLQSVCMPLSYGNQVCYPTLIAIWLVVNYKYLGTGLTGKLQEMPVSNFFSHAGGMLDTYNNHLLHGNVKVKSVQSHLNPFNIPIDTFVWPEGVREVI